MRADCVANQTVRNHFRDPERAWDEGMRLNDGGVSYLAERLAPVCNPLLKQRQVERRLDEMRRSMIERLARFHVDADIETELAKRRAQARTIAVEVAACAERQTFGRMLRLLQVDTEGLQDVCRRIEDGQLGLGPGTPPASGGGVGAPLGARVDGRKLVSAIFDDEPAAPAAPAAPMDQAELFAAGAVAHWSGGIRQAAEDPLRMATVGMPLEQAQQLVSELIEAANRTDLKGSIAGRIRPIVSYRQKAVQIPPQAVAMALQAINAFVDFLGYHELPAERRPRVPRMDRSVFRPRPPVGDLPPLQEQPQPYDMDIYVDWITALRQLVEDNVRFRDGSLVDAQSNGKVARILSMLTA
jgi:hypothetical protein